VFTGAGTFFSVVQVETPSQPFSNQSIWHGSDFCEPIGVQYGGCAGAAVGLLLVEEQVLCLGASADQSCRRPGSAETLR